MELWSEWLPMILAAAAACAGGFADLKCRKIPNRLTIPAMGAGLFLNLLLRGFGGVLSSLAGILAGFAFFLLFVIGALKAGDVKLYMAVGAIGGWRFVLNTMALSVLAGGILSFGILICRKRGRMALRNVWNYLTNVIITRNFYRYEPLDQESYFSFGCCIALGAVAALRWKIW